MVDFRYGPKYGVGHDTAKSYAERHSHSMQRETGLKHVIVHRPDTPVYRVNKAKGEGPYPAPPGGGDDYKKKPKDT